MFELHLSVKIKDRRFNKQKHETGGRNESF